MPGGWLLVKDDFNKLFWVNQELNEVSDDPPNLQELMDKFQRAKKKDQMMAKRGEDKKQNAIKKILGRNMPSANEEAIPSNDEFDPKPPSNMVQKPTTPKTKKDLLQEARKLDSKAMAVEITPEGSVNPYKAARNTLPADQVMEQTTDPKMKRGLLAEDSAGSLDLDLPDMLGETFRR